MDYPRQLDLPFDNKEVLNVSYGRELQQSIDRLTFCARDVYKNDLKQLRESRIWMK